MGTSKTFLHKQMKNTSLLRKALLYNVLRFKDHLKIQEKYFLQTYRIKTNVISAIFVSSIASHFEMLFSAEPWQVATHVFHGREFLCIQLCF